MKRNLWVIIVATFVVFIPYSFAPWGNKDIFYDAQIYLLCGDWINRGMLMYHDMFDEKGPLWYLYEAFGLWIGGGRNEMVWFLDYCVILCTTFTIYSTARNFCNQHQALLTSLFALAYFHIIFLNGGNFAEILSTLAVAISLWIFVRGYIYKCHLSFGEGLLLSLMLCITLFVKANNAAPICFICLYFITSGMKGSWMTFCKYLLCLGISLLLVFFVMYRFHVLNQANWDEFVDAYLLFNIVHYSSPVTWLQRLLIVGKTAVTALGGYILFYLFLKEYWNQDRKLMIWFSLIFISACLFNFIMMGYGGRSYIMPCVPIFALSFALVYKNLNTHRILRGILLVFLIVYSSIATYVRINRTLTPRDYSYLQAVTDFINANTDENDKIITYYDDFCIFRNVKALPASRFFFQMPFFDCNPELQVEFMNDIKQNCPKYILCSEKDNALFIPMGYHICRDYHRRNILERN